MPATESMTRWKKLIAGAPDEQGVYLVLVGGVVIYVGCSKSSIRARLHNHARYKEFLAHGADKVSYVPCEHWRETLECETYFLKRFRPMLSGRPSFACDPQSLLAKFVAKAGGQSEAAELLGVSRQYVCDMVKGRRQVSVAMSRTMTLALRKITSAATQS